MKAVIQLVDNAAVSIDGNPVGSCGKGYMILLGVGQEDEQRDAEVLAEKIVKLRVFEDENGRMNRSVIDIGGEILVVSQFTLYANYAHGNRPDCLQAASPDRADALYQYFVSLLRDKVTRVETGEFGADMKVSLVNNGPVTIVMESEKLKK